MPVWWCVNDADYWKRIVARWFSPSWIEKNDAGQQKRLLMTYPTHHQGNLTAAQYKKRWV
jgi:hypothetical protein